MEFFKDEFLSQDIDRRIERIGVHTAAHGRRDTNAYGTRMDMVTGEIDFHGEIGEPRWYDTQPKVVHRWHLDRGWSGAGYNELYGLQGELYALRDPNVTPAGVRGFNRHALHVCCAGHHDYHDWPDAQFDTLVWRCAYNVIRSGLFVRFLVNKNYSLILGHNEFWHHRLVPSIIRKSCPGTQVSMSRLRLATRDQLLAWQAEYGQSFYKLDCWRNHIATRPQTS